MASRADCWTRLFRELGWWSIYMLALLTGRVLVGTCTPRHVAQKQNSKGKKPKAPVRGRWTGSQASCRCMASNFSAPKGIAALAAPT